MRTIQTNLSAEHQALIEVFFKANKLFVDVSIYDKVYNGVSHRYLEISWDETGETGVKISYMSMVHMGFLNMLDSFLLKCGVDVHDFEPTTLRQQKRKEKEEEQRKFDVYFNERKQSVQSGQNS